MKGVSRQKVLELWLKLTGGSPLSIDTHILINREN
jgi:hypothetical protein